jgi:hypothetical protein
VIKSTTYLELRILVMVSVLADAMRLSSLCYSKKEKLPSGIIMKCNNKGWMREEFIGNA